MLLREWDPLSLMADPTAPRDEYDCLVGPLLNRLQAAATVADLAAHLHHELEEHYGCPFSRKEPTLELAVGADPQTEVT